MKLRESLTYQPVELEFGTSGLRGLVKDMTDLECYSNVIGFLNFLKLSEALQNGSHVYVAGDLRDSTPHIMQVVIAACNDAGLEPVYCGKIPTPTAAYYALYQSAPCIVVTGSHIPNDRNGIKFYKSDGEVLKKDEVAIQKAVGDARNSFYQQDISLSIFTNLGSLKSLSELPTPSKLAENTYVARYTDVFAKDVLRGKQVIVYQHSAVGRDLLVEILEKLGAETIPVERTDVFTPIDTENVTQQDHERFIKFAVDYPGAYAIVSTDGDSDRPFVIDETGVFHRGDVLGCIVTDFLGATFAVTPISSNDAVDIFCKEKGITLLHTKIGSPYVIDAMYTAPPEKKPAVSWEVNGGFLTADTIHINGAALLALPTRDAVLPILCALVAGARRGSKLSELFASLPARYTAGSLIDNVPMDKINQFKAVCNDGDKIASYAKQIFSGSDLGELKKIDRTDGLRLMFVSGDIIHLRPSGNAPQFRVYSNADSQTRANELADKAVSDNGYIEKLLNGICTD